MADLKLCQMQLTMLERNATKFAVTETFENNKCLKFFKNYNVTATEQDIDEFD